MGNPQFIELNGKKIDAVTGRIISHGDSDTKNTPKGTVEGIVNSKVIKPTGFSKIPTQASNLKGMASKSAHKIAPHVQRINQHSKTLMRKSVKKPALLKKEGNSPDKTQSIGGLSKPGGRLQLSREALERAKQVSRNSLVSRFGQPNDIKKIISEKLPPTQPVAPNIDVHAKNLEKLAVQETNITPDQEDTMLSEVALQVANSHKPIVRKRITFYDELARKFHVTKTTLFVSVAVFLVVVIAGLCSYIFYDNIVLSIADLKVGISGHMPSSYPSGFSLSKISYSKTQITINYQSNSDSRNFQVTEKASNWDSQSLLNTTVIPEVGNSYQINQVGGRTVYFYRGEASWVDAGIEYNVINNASLTTDQMTQIIGSL